MDADALIRLYHRYLTEKRNGTHFLIGKLATEFTGCTSKKNHTPRPNYKSLGSKCSTSREKYLLGAGVVGDGGHGAEGNEHEREG
jgi:hypothetical protein